MLQKDPKNAKVLVYRGDAKDSLNDHAGALIDYNAAIAIDPDYEYAYQTRCDTEESLDNYHAAVDDCTKALTLDNNDADAYRDRSYAYFFLGEYQEAKADADQGVVLAPDDAWSIMTRCRAEVGVRQYAPAIQDCTKAAGLSPDYSTAFFYRGRAELEQSSFASALDDFKTALRLENGDNANTHYWMAVCEVSLKAYADAVSDADSYLQTNANDADTLLVRAQAEAGLGQTAQAKYDAAQSREQYKIDSDTDGMARAQALLTQLGG